MTENLSAFDHKRLATTADWLAIAVVVSLPWSTSATSILVVVWLIALLPTLTWPELRRELMAPAGGLPVLLVALAALGMIWAQVPLADRIGGVGSYVKLLAVPLLMAQFRRSTAGPQILVAFLASCVALLSASWALAIWPTLPHTSIDPGVAVKNYIVQSAEFAMCAAVLFYFAISWTSASRYFMALGASLLVVAFLADIFFVSTSRTTLVIIPALGLAYGARHFGWKGLVGAGVIGLLTAIVVWMGSPYVRQRVMEVVNGLQTYETAKAPTSTGLRIAFWENSLEAIKSAPLVGHGTGSIKQQFRLETASHSGMRAVVSTNPHNMTLAVAIELGLLGVVVLWLMWIAQFSLFRGSGAIHWIGLVVVTQNVVGSLFNSFILDFTEGWLFVFGLGVVAGFAKNKISSANG